jgi:putative ABC transport system permease protein
MELRPILSAMLRNKTGAVLVALQIALTLAVVANAVFIIMQRIEKIGRDPGIDSPNIFFVQSYGYGPTYDQREAVRRDLELIRSLPGVAAASPINGVPLSGGGSSDAIGKAPGRDNVNVSANYYALDERGVDALGVKLVEGRAFTEQEILYNPDRNFMKFPPVVIITRELAKGVFGDEPALGRTVYDGNGDSAVVIGVIEHMLGAWVNWDKLGNVMLVPRIMAGPVSRYIVRAEPGRRDALMAEVERKLTDEGTSRAITWVRAHSQFMESSYLADSRMVAFLLVIVGLMISVTALGIVGLATFHVNMRRKQIGTRRAVGARRRDIIRYFMVENWLLTTGGIVLGTVLAFGFGHWLSSAYSLPRLDPLYVAGGTVVLWILGQLAVIVPARRAAAIPPAIATRTV